MDRITRRARAGTRHASVCGDSYTRHRGGRHKSKASADIAVAMIHPPTWEHDGEVLPITDPIPVDEWLQKVSQQGSKLETMPDDSLIAGGPYDGGHVVMVHNEQEDNTFLFAMPPVVIVLLEGLLANDRYQPLLLHTPQLSTVAGCRSLGGGALGRPGQADDGAGRVGTREGIRAELTRAVPLYGTPPGGDAQRSMGIIRPPHRARWRGDPAPPPQALGAPQRQQQPSVVLDPVGGPGFPSSGHHRYGTNLLRRFAPLWMISDDCSAGSCIARGTRRSREDNSALPSRTPRMCTHPDTI